MKNEHSNSHPLIADMLSRNPKVQEAKRLILEAVNQETKKILGVKPPNPDLKAGYEQLINELNESRGSKLRFPYIGSGIGRGALVELLDGSIKYDFITGIGVHVFGHSHPDIIAASIDGAMSNCVMEGNLQNNGESLTLLKLLKQGSKLPHGFLTTSGAMALENGLKIAFQKRTPAYRLLAFENGFSGRTHLLSQLSDKPAFREGLPASAHVDYVPFYDASKPEESTEKAVLTLKKYLTRYPSEHAAMIFELVQGEGGCYPGSRDFFISLMQILKEHQIAIIADEVQTFGRLPELFAFQYFGLQDYVDICTVGKLSLVCATLFSQNYNPRPGLLSQTFTSSTSAIRASIATIQNLMEGNFYGPKGKIVQLHNYFSAKLEAISHRLPHLIKGPFGIGGMIAFTPFGGDVAWVTRMANDLFDAGVISFTAGTFPMRIRMLPPLGVMTNEDIDVVCEIIEETLIKGNHHV